MHLDEHPEEVQKVKEGSLSATEFLIRYCDEQLTDEDLNEEGNTFAEKYYGDDGMYLEDYAEHFGELMYTAPEAAHDYQLFSNLLEKRLKSGKLTK